MESLESKFEKLWEDKTLTNESFFNGMLEISEKYVKQECISFFEWFTKQPAFSFKIKDKIEDAFELYLKSKENGNK